jgi:RAD54-like protein 2
VLRESLPPKQEHVLLVRMTRVQRDLYKSFMAELLHNNAVSNPLKAFAVCCKIWNHPDVLYNFISELWHCAGRLSPVAFQ